MLQEQIANERSPSNEWKSVEIWKEQKGELLLIMHTVEGRNVQFCLCDNWQIGHRYPAKPLCMIEPQHMPCVNVLFAFRNRVKCDALPQEGGTTLDSNYDLCVCVCVCTTVLKWLPARGWCLLWSENYRLSKHKEHERQLNEENCVDQSSINRPSKNRNSPGIGLQICHCIDIVESIMSVRDNSGLRYQLERLKQRCTS